jgi:hypothetical protein
MIERGRVTSRLIESFKQRGARTRRSRTGNRTLDQAAIDASAVAGSRIAHATGESGWTSFQTSGSSNAAPRATYGPLTRVRTGLEKIPLFTEEIKRIFTVDELNTYFATTTRVGSAAHVATEEEYELMREAGMFDDDLVSGATDAILFERAPALLLGGVRGSQ